MSALEAYWNQEEHPELVIRMCVCGEAHLNDPLVSPAWCPPCMEDYLAGGSDGDQGNE